MKPPRCVAAALTLVLMQSCVSLSIGQQVNGIAATVNSKVITKSEVREAVEAQAAMIRGAVKDPAQQQMLLDQLRDRALDALIERQLVLSEFDHMGGSIREEYVDDQVNNIVRDSFQGDRDKFVSELARSNMTMRKFRDLQSKMIVVQVMKQRQMKNLAPPTPAEVEEYYNKHPEKFRDKDFIKMSTITIPKYPAGGDSSATPAAQKKLIDEVRQKVVGGADFGQLAKTYSQDSHTDTDGKWDWVERSLLDKGIAEVAFSLKPGSVSKVVDVGPSYMLILCEAKRPGNSTPLEQVRSDIEKAIKQEKSREALNSWLTALARKASIQPDSVRDGYLKRMDKVNAAAAAASEQ
jgi:peptidyl-prolyl cis-trans isomerase SurA